MASHSRFTPVIFVVSAFVLSACSQLAKQAEAASTEETSTAPQAVEEKTPEPAVEKAELSGQDLFQLLLAEIATNRRELGAAAALYGQLGTNYDDVAVLERAVVLNQSIGQYEDMATYALKWVELRPEEPRALSALAIGQMATGQLTQAETTLESWLTVDPAADVSLLLPAVDELEPDQLLLLETLLTNLQTSFPESGSLYYTRGRLSYSLNSAEEALELTEQSLKFLDTLQTQLFKFQLLLAVDQVEAAGDWIEQIYVQYPTNRQVAIQYTRYLFQYEPDNLEALERIHTRFSTDTTIARSYARAAFDNGLYDSAEAVYTKLLDQGVEDEANYFLGRIDLINAMPEAAIDHFEAVMGAPYLASAMAEWASMGRAEDEVRFIAAINAARDRQPNAAPTLWRLEASYYQLIDRLDDAWLSLDTAIMNYPTDTALLYDQAMVAAVLERYETLENNLEAILELDPSNVNALNALGYTWADLNKNLDLAAEYIDRALLAEPENPAFQDSKGWILYRSGNLAEAIIWLKRAYSQMENDEVAAHIAEVLWYLNRQDEALEYLAEVKRINPSSKYIEPLNELFNL